MCARIAQVRAGASRGPLLGLVARTRSASSYRPPGAGRSGPSGRYRLFWRWGLRGRSHRPRSVRELLGKGGSACKAADCWFLARLPRPQQDYSSASKMSMPWVQSCIQDIQESAFFLSKVQGKMWITHTARYNHQIHSPNNALPTWHVPSEIDTRY